jgi:hypothetical protein
MKTSCYFLLASFPLAESKWPVADWLAVDIIDFIDAADVVGGGAGAAPPRHPPSPPKTRPLDLLLSTFRSWMME